LPSDTLRTCPASRKHSGHFANDKPPTHPCVALAAAQPTAIYLRDGEVVVYRRSRSRSRSRSLLYQCRYKLADGTWHRQTTGRASVEHAVAAACDIYDEARYRQRLGLAHQAHSFAHIANIVLAQLRQQIDASTGTTANNSYVSCIERYFLPYFGERT
jgi:integrase